MGQTIDDVKHRIKRCLEIESERPLKIGEQDCILLLKQIEQIELELRKEKKRSELRLKQRNNENLLKNRAFSEVAESSTSAKHFPFQHSQDEIKKFDQEIEAEVDKVK